MQNLNFLYLGMTKVSFIIGSLSLK